jgi:hypothetical protein
MAHNRLLDQTQEGGMKYLMSALIISGALAIAVPVWAQTPTVSGHHHPKHRHNMYGMYGSPSRYSAADRLNAEELATLQSGASVNRMPSGGKQLTSPNR